MANSIIQLRHSNVTGNTPASLANGEIAINIYDGKIFYRGGVSNTIQSFLKYGGPAGLDTEVQFNDSGVLGADAGLTFNKTTKNLTANGQISGSTLKSTQSSGDEGGQIDLATAVTNTTLVGGSVNLDIYQNKLRIFESGGTNRGVYIDLSSASTGVGTDLLNPSATPDTVARNLAQGAFNQANAAYDTANSASNYANSAFAAANTAGGADQFARNQANAAFNRANSFGAVTISDNTTTPGTFYPLFVDAISGNLAVVNVASTELTFEPSSGSLSAVNFISLSDERYKKNVITITNATQIINKIDGVSFNWVKNDRPAYGVIAQEIEKVLPEIVHTNEEGVKTVNYDSLIPFLIQTVKEQGVEIQKLKEEIVTINKKLGN